jgi:beta-glucanase (GH16 family)
MNSFSSPSRSFHPGQNPLLARRTLAVILCWLAFALGASAQTWKLVWSDEFNGPAHSSIDPNNWQYDSGILNVNNEVEYYCAPLSSTAPCNAHTPNAYIDGQGHLVIQAFRITSSTAPNGGSWTSARLKTANRQTFHYGRIESSMSLPVGPALWPAFWALGTNIDSVGWPMSGEIDYMENVPASGHLGPRAIRSTIHGGNSDSSCYCGGNGLGKDYRFSAGDRKGPTVTTFHTYGGIWSTNMLQFYVDDPANIFFVITASDVPSGLNWDHNHPFFLLLNLAVGGTDSWPGPPDSSTPSPAVMAVDYVRAYTPSVVAGPKMTGPAIHVAAGKSGTSTLSLKSAAGSGRVYLTCTTNAAQAACVVSSTDALNPHTVDFSWVATATATVTVTTTGNTSPVGAPGSYFVTVNAFTVSNTTGSPDSTATIPLHIK